MSERLWAFESGELWGVDLNDARPRVEPRCGAEFRECTLDSVPALAGAMDLSDAYPVRERLRTGRRCFIAWVDDQVAAYGWVSLRPEYIGEQEREIRLQPNEAYIWDCATLPEFRGRRLYSALLSQTLNALNAEGTRRVWIGSSLTNQPSRRGFANAGFQPVITLVFARLWRLRLLWVRTPRSAPRELAAIARNELLSADEHVWHSIVWGWSSVTGSHWRTETGLHS